MLPVIQVENVSKTYEGDIHTLQDVTFTVEAGEFVTLIGPSGSGKSTLFNIIAGLVPSDSGHITLNSGKTHVGKAQVAYMPQSDLLMPWRSILDNAIVPLEINGISKSVARERARELFPVFGLEGFADAYPSDLSGGMRQRAALLRTMLVDSDILLLDEPFGALDALTRRELQTWLLDIWRDSGKTVLFITHDVEEAIYLGDRVLLLSKRPGTIQRQVTVNVPRPRTRHMMEDPYFGSLMVELLSELGVTI